MALETGRKPPPRTMRTDTQSEDGMTMRRSGVLDRVVASPDRDSSPEERARLLAEAALYRMEADLLFDRVGVESGWQTLDLGCGPLGVLDVLAERVGARGVVVGVDCDQTMLDAAADELTGRGLAGVRLVRGDVAAAAGMPGAFDLVHTRFTLGDLQCPADAVANMVQLTRPGGWVALQDADLVSWTCEPACPAWDRLASALTVSWAGDPRVGRRLPGMLRAAGLEHVEVDVHAGVWHPGEPHHGLLAHLVGLHRDRIITLGLLSGAEVDQCLAELHNHLARADTLVLSWTLFQAWGRRPFTL